MIAANSFLSQLQIAYSGLTQAQEDQMVQDCIAIWRARKTGTYHSPATLPLPTVLPGLVPMPGTTMAQAIQNLAQSPWSQFSAPVDDAQEAANAAFIAAFRSGNIAATHAAVDGINAIQPLTKQPWFVPRQSDFQILLTSPQSVGALAQMLNAQANDAVDDSQMPPLFTADADAIMAANGIV